MKVIISPEAAVSTPVGTLCGVKSYASFDRIITAMKYLGELRLEPDEYIDAVQVEEQGLTFVIAKKL